MTYEEILNKARQVMGPNCRVCPECNGLACRGEIPGLGGIGSGNSFTTTRDFFNSIKVLMDVVYEAKEVDTSIKLFGNTFDMPFFIAPLGGMSLNYNGYLTEHDYIDMTVKGTRQLNTFAFTPDGPNKDFYYDSLSIIAEAGGMAVPTIKPWETDLFMDKVQGAIEANAMAVACDIDSCGNLNLRNAGLPVKPMSPEFMKNLVDETGIKFIAKGIMTAESAVKCKEAGCYGIVVSTHGGRVIEDAPAPAAMLAEIRGAVGPDFKIFVDGGIRSGRDVFKCLALGADAVLIGRPYTIAVHGGGVEGVKIYTEKILSELKDTMLMTACTKLSDITIDKIVEV